MTKVEVADRDIFLRIFVSTIGNNRENHELTLKNLPHQKKVTNIFA